MSATEKTISSLIKTQLPDFVRADHPQFKRFLELYYKWLETNDPAGVSPTGGNTVYQAMNIGDYRDIDQSPDEFLRFFKQELLPYFPENPALDIRKILKGAREFYAKKGSEESVKWLFKVLFNEDIEINYPKEQILKTSDGKWKKPKAFRITVGETNKNVDVNLLEKKLVTGNVSGATCIVESADRTIDTNSGKEIIELYISNIKRYFNNGEYITINYTDANGIARTFSEKIIGTISNIYLDSNIKTDPQQKRRGLLYNVGDPVVITGGLDLTPEAKPGVAIVGNVSTGSIEAVTTIFPGYGYRLYSNTEVLVLRSVGDDPNANANTDLRVFALNLSLNAANSQKNFIESITYDKSVIDYLGDVVIGTANLAEFTSNNFNAVLNVTEADAGDGFNTYEQVWANGTNYFDAKFTAKIATSNTAGPFAQGGIFPATGGLLVYDIANTGALATVLSGQNIYTKNTAKSFTFNSVTTSPVPANANSQIVQCLRMDTVNTGGIALITVKDGGAGFRSPPKLKVTSEYDTILSENYTYGTGDKANTVQTFKDLGLIAHVYINNGGTGYANGDTITFSGRGYSGSAYVTVGSGGVIKSVTITDRGEGHLVRPTCIINTSGGSGAVLTAYLFGDGFDYTVQTSAIGRIKDIRLIYRGYDYIARPNVSLKIVDTVINPIPELDRFTEEEYIFQGTSLSTSTFRANVKSYDRTTNLLRLYDHSGVLDKTVDLVSANGVHCSLNTSANVYAPAQYPSTVIATGLPNPMYYGDGRAKAIAAFANGLIEFNGFYLNTDGFVSSDKVLQDGSVYHNFSYIVQSGKDLAEYKTSLQNIVHPSGMKPISKRIIATEYDSSVQDFPFVDYIKPPNPASNVQIANSYSNVVTGNGTAFLVASHKVNVGDLFIISDSGNPMRSLSKIISDVDSNIQLRVYGDFIYVGQGKASTNNGNTWININGASNSILDFVQNGDEIRMNLVSVVLTGTVNVSGTTVTGNTTGANTTYFVGNVVVGSEVTINNETRLVTTVTNNSSLTVNTAFAYSATNKYLVANSVLVKTISSISGNTLIMNSAYFATKTNLVYQVVPNYSSADYNYKIVTLTAN
jgi:hypothetical protein